MHQSGVLAIEEGDIEIETEFDPYYSNIGMFINLADEPVPELGEAGEFEVYKDLLSRSLVPRFMLVEASINPLPVAGVLIRRSHPVFYDNADYGNDSNWVETFTAGFEEPWALALFLGNRVDFKSPKNLEEQNRGFMGYLLSVGNYHIKRNQMIDDHWMELEWKVKGDKVLENYDLSWSFRFGFKFHNNRDITDEFYIGIRRDRIQNNMEVLSFFHNGGIEFTYRMDKNTGNSIGQKLIIDKKIPLGTDGIVFSIGFGFTRDTRFKYKRSLQDDSTDTTFLLRPSLEF